MVVGASLAYLGLLFGIAYHGDRRAAAGRSLISSGAVYALSLAVYATSWTYYGSVGRATTRGVEFLAIYLGPTLMLALGAVVLRKIIRISKRYRITSLSDFVAARYGNSTLLGGLVALVAVVGIVPYIALQLKAVSSTFLTLQSDDPNRQVTTENVPLWADTSLYVALVLAAFTILFGTRHLDATERHEGMVAAIAVESVVKLVAFLAAGLFVTFGIFGGFGDLVERAAADPSLAALFTLGPSSSYANLMWLTLLAGFAVLMLPRQFQIAVVENVDERHVRTAVWLFPLYLLVINIFVLPIALGGMLTFAEGTVSPDTFVLALPASQQQAGLALLVFIGGLSAATGMVIVETIALSTMVSNSLVMPLVLRRRGVTARRDLGAVVLRIRRFTILAVLLLGFGFFRVSGDALGLVDMGLVSFAAVAQFAPALLGGLWWKGATRDGAVAGLVAGIGIWTYTLLLPELAVSGWLPTSFVTGGPFGMAMLRPQELFGLTGMGKVGHGVFWCLLVNVALYVGVSLAGRLSPAEAGQAELFVDVDRQRLEAPGPRFFRGTAPVAELRRLLTQFLGAGAATAIIDGHRTQVGTAAPGSTDERVADAELVQHVEIALAGAIGPAAARAMVASVVDEEPLGMAEVIEIVGEASRIRAYSRELERQSAELEAATAELRAANEALRELDRLKDDFISTVTHELRTPLTSIRALTEILRDNTDLPVEERERFLGIVVVETERLTRLINQVLDLAKLESGNMQWELAEVDLRAVIEDSASASAQLFADRGVTLAVDVPEQAPTVTADRDGLVQVVLNLLSNAVKFSPERDGQVHVRLRAENGVARLDVADNGPGVRPADREIIFDKFRQGGDGDRPAGTGLGLPISMRIVEQFGGSLQVQAGPDENTPGAVFSMRLPVR